MQEKDRDKKKDIRIAVPTNDEVTIFPKMLGMADKMFVYELSGDHITLLEKRNNPYAKTQQHLKTLDVYELVHDCVIIIFAHIGKKGIQRLQDRGVKLMYRKGNIQKALQDITGELKQNS
jgi:predicted Fe-Mo cluster-binding NifX family protein